MTDIVEKVARAIAQNDAEAEGLEFPTGPMAYRAYMGIARAAIDAYEAAKMDDLFAGMLTHEVASDGTAKYVERSKWLDNEKHTNKWMSSVVARLAERKP